MSAAFQGSAAVKQTLFAAFDDAVGLPALAALARDSGGYPEALVRFLDRLLQDIANGDADGRNAARARARQCLSDVAPGADLGAVPGHVMVYLLRDIDVRADLGGAAPALHDLLLRLADLHARRRDGGDVAPRDWADIRRAAMALTDTVDTLVLKRAGQAIEAAAWDLTTSSGILIDVLKAFQELLLIEAGLAWGWTTAEERRAHDMLQAIYDETQSQRDAGEEIFIPALFRAREPALSRRFDKCRTVRSQRGYAGSLALMDTVLALLANAPLALAEDAAAARDD